MISDDRPVLIGGVLSSIPFASISIVCHHWAVSFPAYSMYVVRLKNTALHGGFQGAPVSAPGNEILSTEVEAWRRRRSRRKWKKRRRRWDCDEVGVWHKWVDYSWLGVGWKGKTQKFRANNQIWTSRVQSNHTKSWATPSLPRMGGMSQCELMVCLWIDQRNWDLPFLSRGAVFNAQTQHSFKNAQFSLESSISCLQIAILSSNDTIKYSCQ